MDALWYSYIQQNQIFISHNIYEKMFGGEDNSKWISVEISPGESSRYLNAMSINSGQMLFSANAICFEILQYEIEEFVQR